MSRPHPAPRSVSNAFDDVCAQLETALNGPLRRHIVAEVAKARDATRAMERLRDCMRSDVWEAGKTRVDLAGGIGAFDKRVRQDGFHAIHDWDGKAERVNDDTIAIDILNYAIERRGTGVPDLAVLGMIVDYYFLYVLALLSLNVWDDGRADEQLDRLEHLLNALQGPHGSGQRFAGDAATLMLLATSHYESDDHAYDRLLERVRTLGRPHRAKIARIHALCLGGHLRFGIESTYGQDFRLMRDDNGVDYRWLCFALAIVMEDYARLCDAGQLGPERDIAVEALLNGLSADVDAFATDRRPSSLDSLSEEWRAVHAGLQTYRRDLVEAFAPFRPPDEGYSPIALFFNFSQNVLKGIVADALLWGEPRPIGLNELLTGVGPSAGSSAAKATLARTLMSYARAKPDRIRGLLAPAIVYDPRAGRRAFAATIRALSPAPQET
jgi:hypothetical protein